MTALAGTLARSAGTPSVRRIDPRSAADLASAGITPWLDRDFGRMMDCCGMKPAAVHTRPQG
jgi:hypothetical protein